MNSFSKSVFNGLFGKLNRPASSVVSTSDVSTSFGKVAGQFKGFLEDRVSIYDNVILALTSNSDLISDNIIDSDFIDWNQDDFSNYATVITSDVSNDIVNAVHGACLSLGASDDADAVLHLIDESGRDFLCCKPTDEHAVLGYEILLASTLSPEDLTDAIIYKDLNTGTIYFNNLWRPYNIISKELTVQSNTVIDDIAMYAQIKGASIHGLTIQSMLMSFMAGLNLVTSYNYTLIYDLQRISEYYDDNISNFIELHDFVNSHIEQLSKPVFFMDVVKSITESNLINQLCLDVTNLISKGGSSLADLDSYISKESIEKYHGVNEVYQNIKSSYGQYGPESAIQYITSLFTKTKNIIISSDHRLQFTDNQSLVPQQFISGLVAGVVETVVQGLSLLVTVVNAAVGLAVSLIGGIFGTIFSGLSSMSSGNASLLNSIKCSNDGVPYGFLQTVVSYSSAEQIPEFMKTLFVLKSRGFTFNVPGGTLVVGYQGSTYDGNNVLTGYTFICEFHPSTSFDGYCVMRKLYNKCADIGLVKRVSNSSSAPAGYQSQVWYLGSKLDLNIAQYYLAWTAMCRIFIPEILGDDMTFSQASSVDTVDNTISNKDDGHLSDVDDMLLRTRVTANLAYFMLWLTNISNSYILPTRQEDNSLYGSMFVNYAYDGDHQNPGFAEWGSYNSAWWLIFRSMISCSAVYTTTIAAKTVKVWPTLFCPSWTTMNDFANNMTISDLSSKNYMNLISGILSNKEWIGVPVEITGDFTWSVTLPTYDGTTFWRNFGIAMAVTAAAAAITISATILIKKKVQTSRFKNALKVEQAYNAAIKDPSKANIKAYRKAVRKNNLYASIFGGTKYGYSNYWGQMGAGESATSSSDTGSSLSSSLSNLFASAKQRDLDQGVTLSLDEFNELTTDGKLSHIKYLIDGIENN